MFPTTPTAVPDVAVAPHATLADRNFGLASHQRLDLNASRVLSLVSGDVIEKDWNGTQTQAAHRDIDLVAGADAGGTDRCRCGSTTTTRNSPSGANRDYSRTTPNAVLSLAVDTLGTDPPPFRDRADLVTGTGCRRGQRVRVAQPERERERRLPADVVHLRVQDAGRRRRHRRS